MISLHCNDVMLWRRLVDSTQDKRRPLKCSVFRGASAPSAASCVRPASLSTINIQEPSLLKGFPYIPASSFNPNPCGRRRPALWVGLPLCDLSITLPDDVVASHAGLSPAEPVLFCNSFHCKIVTLMSAFMRVMTLIIADARLSALAKLLASFTCRCTEQKRLATANRSRGSICVANLLARAGGVVEPVKIFSSLPHVLPRWIWSL